MVSQSELAIFAFNAYRPSDANYIDLDSWQRNVALATTGTAANEVQIGSTSQANALRGGAGNDLLIN